MIEQLLENYYEFIKKNTKIKRFVKGYHEIQTPLLDRFNDNIHIFAKIEDDKIILTDDFSTVNNLEVAGIKIKDKRLKTIEGVCSQYGIQFKDGELYLETTPDEFAGRMEALIQCMIKVDDMYYISRENVINYFVDDVRKYFDDNEIYYSENISYIGKSGYAHTFDMSIQRTKTRPERIVKILNKGTKSNFIATTFGWDETMPQRKDDSILYVIINDNNPIEHGVLNGFLNRNITPILWNEREGKKSLFAN